MRLSARRLLHRPQALPTSNPTFPARFDSLLDPWRGTDRPGCAVGVHPRARGVTFERAAVTR